MQSDRTIEFELTADELFLCPQPRRAAPPLPRGGVRGAITLSIALGALATFAWGIAQRDSSLRMRSTPATLSAGFSAPSSTPVTKAVPVRYANPFDAIEFFEFPPGTSREHAREAVAEFLLDRAHDRHIQHLQRSRTPAA